MVNRLGLSTAAACLLAAVLGPQAGAQEVLHAPDAIRACLCQHQTMDAYAADLSAARQSYQSETDAVQALDAQVQAAKAKLDPADLAAREAYAALLQRRDAAASRLAADATPTYNAAVQRYNAAVLSYKDDCAGKSYDADTLAKVRTALSCPAEAKL
jgi:Skp family chaperone for outer membrane proteins